MFFKKFIQAKNEDNTKNLYYCPIVQGSITDEFPAQNANNSESVPCHGGIICSFMVLTEHNWKETFWKDTSQAQVPSAENCHAYM